MVLHLLFFLSLWANVITAMEEDPGSMRKVINFGLKRLSPAYQETYIMSPKTKTICADLRQKALQGIADNKISPMLAEQLHQYNERGYWAAERFITLLSQGKPDDIERIYQEIDHDVLSPLIKLYIVGFLTHSTLMLEEKASKRTATITGQTCPEATITQTREHQRRLLNRMAGDLKKESDNFLAQIMDNTAKLVDDRFPISRPISISRQDSEDSISSAIVEEDNSPKNQFAPPLSSLDANTEKEEKEVKTAISTAAATSVIKPVNKQSK